MGELYEDLWLSGRFEAEGINQLSSKGYSKSIWCYYVTGGFPCRDWLQGPGLTEATEATDVIFVRVRTAQSLSVFLFFGCGDHRNAWGHFKPGAPLWRLMGLFPLITALFRIAANERRQFITPDTSPSSVLLLNASLNLHKSTFRKHAWKHLAPDFANYDN